MARRLQDWRAFFQSLEALKNFDVPGSLKRFWLVGDAEVDAAAELKVADAGKRVLIPGLLNLRRVSVSLLALDFGRGAEATSSSHTIR
jgi:hypothetical protein